MPDSPSDAGSGFCPVSMGGHRMTLARYPKLSIAAPSISVRNKHSVCRSIIQKVEIIFNQTLT